MHCPICENYYPEQFKWINCESFDDSYLYKDITIYKCKNCGHIYNYLNDVELKNLMKYYEQEYAPINISSKDRIGDKPGSTNQATMDRYDHVFDFISSRITKDSRILDVGCALGGFINFLKDKGYKNLYGIDPIKAYVNKANNENIKIGNVKSIPFEDNSFDIIILDQVLEHLSNLKLTMKEIKRVLKKGGLLYIGVPDVDGYNDDIYYWIIREHIQHFSIVGIKLLAQTNGFEFLEHELTDGDMVGDLKLPNLSVLLKVSDQIYCWGIGREFMYYHLNTRLKNHDLILVDDTPQKQKHTFKGMKIHSSEILKEADKDSFLIITAMVHKRILKEKAWLLGYKGEIIDV